MNLVYDRKSRHYAEDNRTELSCTHRDIGKSEAEVTNNIRLHSGYCTAETNY